MSRTLRILPTKLRQAVWVCAALLVSVGAVAAVYRPTPVAAACSSSCVASMSASPASGTYNPGATVTVSVVVNSGGQSVNAIQSDFTYTSSRLEYVAGTASGTSGWTTYISNVGSGSGSVVIGKTTGAAVSGAVITIQFKVLSSAGAASIGFSSSSSVVSSTSNQDILGSTSGASYSVVDPTPPPTQTTTPTSSPTQTTTQPGPTPSTGTYKKPAPTSSQPTTTTTSQPTPETSSPVATTAQPKTEDPTSVNNTATIVSTKKIDTWLMPALIVGGIVIVGAGGAGAWLMLRRRHSIIPVTGGSMPTSDFITGPGSSMPPVQPPVTPVQPQDPTPTAQHDEQGPFSH